MKFTAYIEDPSKKASIKVQKVASASNVKPRETITYLYTVTNTGRVQVDGITINDDKCSPVTYVRGGTNHASNIMDPGETWEYECTTTLTTTTENTVSAEAFSIAGTRPKVTDKATVKVTVGPCPPPKIPIPYVVYMTEEDGKAELKKNSLEGDVTARRYSTDVDAGAIIEQFPRDGECVDPGSGVGLVISKGKKPEEPETESKGALEAKLDCNGFLELLPGEVSESCGIMVRNWKSDTTTRVEVVFPQQTSMGGDLGGGIVAFPGSTSSDPTNMHVAGVQDPNSPYYGWYTFTQGFSAKQDAKPSTSAIQIVVRQGDQQVQLQLTITVLPKGATRSTGPGLRPPAEVKPGSGGIYCVWRYKLIGDAPACFHFHAAPCASYPSRDGYELVGQNMKFSEADARIGELSRYYSDQYGCEAVAPPKPEEPPPPPAEVKPGSGGVYCVWRYHLFGDPPACFHFHAAACAAYPSRAGYDLVGQNMKQSEADARIQELSRYFDDQYGCLAGSASQPDCSGIAGSSALPDKSGKITCQCPPDNVLNKAGNACITGPQKQVAAADCSSQPGTVATWDPDTEQVTCECPAGTKWFNNACMSDKDIKMAQADCSGLSGSSPQWDEGSGEVKCVCPAGTKPFNGACMSDKDIKMAQADCSIPAGSSPQWDEGSGQVKCVCPADRRVFQNACMTEKEILALSATGAISILQGDCSSFPGTSPRLNSSTGQMECVCPTGMKWFNNACTSDRDIKLAQADCSSMPGTSPRLNSATGQVECVCPSGTKWFNNKCTSDRDITVAQADCSSMPGASPRLNSATGQVECVCPAGTKWFNNACVTDKDVKLAQADCSSMPGTSPRLNPQSGQVECVCPAGTKWFNNACVTDKDVKLAQADCSSMPGTSPRLNSATGQVECVCPSGTKWFNNKCTSDRDITVAQADCSRFPGTSPQLDPTTGQVKCVCPPGTKWFNNRCTSDRDITVAQADCSRFPGTSPQLEPTTGQVKCVCPIGTTWDRTNNRCLAPVPASTPPLPPKPPAPPKPTPPAPPKPGSAGQCDPPICIDMCKRNCQSFSQGAIDFCTHGCDKARPCTAQEKDDAKSLAKVKAECYRNILTRCNQGQSGRTGDWCVGPGADKTCDKRAHSVCGCDPQTHPECGGKWD